MGRDPCGAQGCDDICLLTSQYCVGHTGYLVDNESAEYNPLRDASISGVLVMVEPCLQGMLDDLQAIDDVSASAKCLKIKIEALIESLAWKHSVVTGNQEENCKAVPADSPAASEGENPLSPDVPAGSPEEGILHF